MRKLFTLISIALFGVTAWANENKVTGEPATILIGNYNSDYYADQGGTLYSVVGADSVIAATIIPESKYSALSDGKITAVRFALAATVKVTNAYVYKVAEKGLETLAIVPIEGGQGHVGWNTVTLPTPIDLPKEADLMIGFTYFEVAKTYPLSLNTNISNEDGTYVYITYNGKQGWYNLSDNGVLCMQAYVETSMLPEYDMKMNALALNNKYQISGQSGFAYFYASNFGSGKVDSYKFEVTLDNDSLTTVTEASEVKLSMEDAIIAFEFTLPADMKQGEHTLSVKATEINGKAITYGVEDDELNTTFTGLAPSDVVDRQRFVVEEFTSQSCTYCPRGAAVLSKMQELHPEKVAVACLHGNMSAKDAFNTTQVENMLAYLGCNAYPTGVLNRNYLPADKGIVTGLGYEDAEMGAGYVWEDLNAYAMPALASVDIQTLTDGTDLTITVSGKGGNIAKTLLKDYSLTVYVLEDSLVASQLKNGFTVKKYTHRHVVRKVATAINGDDLQWTSDSTYSNEIKVTLDASWLVNKMSVVAFLSKKQPLSNPDYTDMAITNGNEAKLTDGTVGIEQVAIEPATDTTKDQKIYVGGQFSILHEGRKFDLLGR